VLRFLALIAVASLCGLAQTASVSAGPKPTLPCKLKASKAYPGDDAPRTEIAEWMARVAAKAGLPPELPVMASLVESGLTNLPYGDTDSAGFFQMRVSIWNTGPYAGFPDDPELQLKWFVDQALLVMRQRLADGISLEQLLGDPQRWGEWIADVERPAEADRGRYQLRLEEARSLICG
jgi:hypothetical protein